MNEKFDHAFETGGRYVDDGDVFDQIFSANVVGNVSISFNAVLVER